MGATQDPLNDPEATFNGGFLLGDDESGQVERQVVSRADLLARLTALVQSGEGCEQVAVIGITRLDKPDTEGCNWSSSVVLEPAGVAPEVYVLAYATAVAVARVSWNLK